jgi:hypothetical protein
MTDYQTKYDNIDLFTITYLLQVKSIYKKYLKNVYAHLNIF